MTLEEREVENRGGLERRVVTGEAVWPVNWLIGSETSMFLQAHRMEYSSTCYAIQTRERMYR
jgi:hypothetical protein